MRKLEGWTVAELAEEKGCSTRTVYVALKDGPLRRRRDGLISDAAAFGWTPNAIGRPPLPQAQKASKRLEVRFTPPEWDQLEEKREDGEPYATCLKREAGIG